MLCLCAQLSLWSYDRVIKPNLEVVPNVPGQEYVEALTFGDKEFFFRVLAFQIQITGDTFGRFTPLRDYDMNKLYHWFKLLDTLDARSDMMPSMAAYYYSQTQHTPDIRYMVDYLYEHATNDIEHKWWWLVQAIYLAMHKLGDMDLALKVAKPLVDEHVPVWAQQMAAVVHEKRGEMGDALQIMETIKDNAKEIPERDLKYMIYFVKERLHRLDKLEEMKSIHAVPDKDLPLPKALQPKKSGNAETAHPAAGK